MLIILKGITILAIIGICSYLGMIKAKTFDNRVMALKQIQNALAMFKSKIEFTYEPIKDIFEEISCVIYQDKKNIFQETVKEMATQNVSQAWYMAIDDSNHNLSLEDKETMKMLGKLLGKTDKQGQISEIQLTSVLLANQIEKAEQEKDKNTKLYKTLGTVLGLGIAIILI